MGFLDDLKHKVEQLGDKAREGFEAAKDGASDLVDDAKERLTHADDQSSPLSESSDVGPDTTSTDAVQPGYVAAEDDDTETSDEASLEVLGEDEEVDDLEAPAAAGITDITDTTDITVPAAAELDAEELGEEMGEESEPAAVATDVDPYEQPLTESIGDEIAAALVDSDAVAEAVDTTATDRDA